MSRLNLNTFPYYDDFNPVTGYHRILFKPGYAVQARELTQIQTILQEQIKRFGNHIFKEGSVVYGCAETANFIFPYVRLAASEFDVEEGLILTSPTGVRAVVKKVDVDPEDGVRIAYIQYIEAGYNGETEIQTNTFTAGELLNNNLLSVAVGPNATGFGSLFSIGEGIVYVNGTFVFMQPQTVVVERYSTTPTKKIGFLLNEEIITTNKDETLLDPALGSYNYTGLGADRYKLTPTLVAVDDIEEGFFILFDIEEGNIKRKYNVSQYAELNKTLARRTYDESGDYTIRSFPIVLREHLKDGNNGGRYTSARGGDAGKLVVSVEPGKAYVKGYEHELFATEYLDIDKSFESQEIQNVAITTAIGNYVLVSSISGVFPVNQSDRVELRNGASTIIGTAWLRGIEVESAGVYRLYLHGITFTEGALADVVTITSGSATATLSSPKVLLASRFTPAVFEIPYTNVKTLSDQSYVYRKVFTGVSSVSPTFSISAGSDAWAFTVPTINDIIVIRSNGTYVPVDIENCSVSGQTLTIALDTPVVDTVTVMANIRRTVSANPKSLQRNQYVRIETGSSEGPYNLGFPDVFRIVEVWSADDSTINYPVDPAFDNNWTNSTDKFTLDDGQRDTYYDHAKLVATENFTNKKLIVKLDYFEHGSSSGYYTVDSYELPLETEEASNNEIEWIEIPHFVSTAGVRYNLRNCIDFRPTIQKTATPTTVIADSTINPTTDDEFISGFTHPSPTEEFIADIQIHLARLDRVVLDSEGIFSVIRGTPAVAPSRPSPTENSMTLGFVYVAPFPSLSPANAARLNTPEYACAVSLVDNRRFTMRDIGRISRRVENLEQETSLTILEQAASSLFIPNNSGENRFKNGILVDSFIGHNVGDVTNSAYSASIANGILRPSYKLENVEFTVSSTSQATQTGNIITLPYDKVVYAENPFASKTRNLASTLLFGFQGVMTLNPPSDTWADVNSQPVVQNNDDGILDNWQLSPKGWTSQWKSWETIWQGVTNEQESSQQLQPRIAETTQQRRERLGTGLAGARDSYVNEVGEKTISTSLIPFMRSRVVVFSAVGMKPNTQVYAYFDGIDVSANCRTTGAEYGDALRVDEDGLISGEFLIPENTFTTGTKTFILVDDDDYIVGKFADTIAVAQFVSSGTSTFEERTIICTQAPEVTLSQLNQSQEKVVSRITRIGGTSTIDPLAQTFYVSGNSSGIMLTDIDVYFKTKSNTAPVTLQIREVVNGYPSEIIVPYSTVTLFPDEVSVSATAATATTFTFDTPVFLKNETEYCFILLTAGNDENYEVWVAELGQAQIGSTQIIDKQPYAGALFVPGNDIKWNVLQNEDIKFTLKKAKFNTAANGEVVFSNKPMDYLKLTDITGEIPVGTLLTSDDSGAEGTVVYYDTVNNVATVQVMTGEFAAGETVNTALAEIEAVENKIIHAISPNIGFLNFGNTEIQWSQKIYNNNNTNPGVFTELAVAETTELLTEKAVFSHSNTTNTFQLKATLVTDSEDISPVIDTTKVSTIIVRNDTTSEYITRRVILNDGQESDDIRVYFTAKVPSSSTVVVSAKLLNDADATVFDDRPWTVLTAQIPTNPDGFKQYLYTLASGNTTTEAGGLNGSGVYQYEVDGVSYTGYKTFAVKIEMTSASPETVPEIRDLQIIALQA